MADDTPNEDDPTTDKNFWSFLREHKRGALNAELTEKLHECVASVIEHGKTATLTLKLEIKPAGDGDMVRINDDLVGKPALADRGGSFFYSDEAGGLYREDPSQMKLDTELRVVELNDGEPVRIDAASGEVVDIR